MSTKSDGQVVIEIVGDDSELGKSLNDATKKTDRFGQELQRVNELLKLDPKNIVLCEQKTKLLTNEIETTKNRIELLKQAEKEAQAQFEKGEATEEQYRSIQREIIGTEQALEKLTKEQSNFQKELDGADVNIQKVTESSEDMNKQMVAVSTACDTMAVALFAVGAQALQASMEFDSAFAKTQTIMDHNAVSAKQMREEIKELSKDSGMSAVNVSEAVYEAISASVATEDATAFVDQANKLAVSGFTSLENATDVLTTVLNAYGLEAESVSGISNVLVQTQNLGKATVDELAHSMGKAISTGSAYGVNLENLAAAYVQMTNVGIDTAWTTTYVSSMLNELGDAGSKVGGILQQETGQSFGELMAQGWSLGDVLQVLSDAVNGDTEALMGLWSSQEAGKASNAILKQSVEEFNAVCDQMQQEMAGTTGTTEKAYKTMTSTSEFIDQRFNNSINNLGIAFGDNLSPAVDGAKSLLTGIVEGATSIVEKYPSISAVVTGLTVGVGALAIALTAHTLKTKLATAETLKLTAAMMSNPLTWVLVGVSAVTAAFGVYGAKTAEATEETEKLSATSELQKRELEDLQKEYEEVCDTMGETSAEAQLLKEKIDEQTESFEKNKQTAEEYQEQQDEFWDGIQKSKEAHNERIEAIDKEYDSTVNLIDKLDELTSAEEQTAASKEKILSIVDLLNERIPELGLKYDSLTGKVNLTPEQITEVAKKDYETQKQQAQRDRLVELYEEEDEASQKYAQSVSENTANYQVWKDAEAKMKNFGSDLTYHSGGYAGAAGYYTDANGKEITAAAYQDMWNQVVYAEQQAREKWEASADEVWENKAAYEGVKTEIEETADSIASATVQTETVVDEIGAMTSVTDDLTASMDALGVAYTEAYEAAYDSISGQYALWDTAADVVAMDADAVMAALQSQEDYWKNYNANINELIARQGEVEGLDEMIAAFGDGSEESVNMIAMMAGMSNTELEGLVAQFRETTEAEKTASESLGEAKVGLKQRTQEVIDEAVDGINQLNLSDEARQSGIDTINGYIEGVGELLPDVQNAYLNIGAVIRAALNGDVSFRQNPTVYGKGGSVSSYASGTLYANSGLALVGEAGPELVYLRGGERILNAEETKAILNTVYPVAPNMAMVGAGAPAIAGRGSVQLRATIAVPVQVDGREFARATAQYMGEEMDFEVM